MERRLTVGADIAVRFLLVHRNECLCGIQFIIGHVVNLHRDDVAADVERTSHVGESRVVIMVVQCVLCHSCIALVLTVKEALGHCLDAVIRSPDATFCGIIRVTVAGPVHLILGIGVFTRVVCGKGAHGDINIDTWSAG